MNEKDEMMLKLQQLDFALVDLGLYLDTHPDCAKALADRKDLGKQRRALAESYEQTFGPLTAGGVSNTDYYDWTATPWPWECR